MIVLGENRKISFAACMPFIRGMAISRITTSGHAILAFSTASTPSAASAHISKSVLSASSSLMAALASSLSSARRIFATTVNLGVRRYLHAEERKYGVNFQPHITPKQKWKLHRNDECSILVNLATNRVGKTHPFERCSALLSPGFNALPPPGQFR